jgi:hypothetical protein
MVVEEGLAGACVVVPMHSSMDSTAEHHPYARLRPDSHGDAVSSIPHITCWKKFVTTEGLPARPKPLGAIILLLRSLPQSRLC